VQEFFVGLNFGVLSLKKAETPVVFFYAESQK